MAGEGRRAPDVERELERRATDERRQSSGSTPTEDEMERALQLDEDVEHHWGEDAGEVPDTDRP